MRRLASFALLVVSFAAHAQGVTLPPSERVVLDNGTVLTLSEKHDVPLVAVDILIRGGSLGDPDAKDGVSALLASLLEKGSGERDSALFAETVAAVGGQLSVSAAQESINVWGNFLSRDAELMIELAADMLIRPALDADEFERLRQRRIDGIRSAKDGDPRALMPIYAEAFLFGDHPYASSVQGSESSLETIRHQDVLDYYERHLGGDRLIVSVSGDFDTAEMRTLLEEAFGDWRPASAELPEAGAAEPAQGTRVLLVDKPGATQTYFWIGNVGVARSYPQRADLNVANTVFGGRFTSMLNTALRVDSGLTYGARSRLSRNLTPGSVGISSYTETSSTIEAIDTALGVLATLHAEGIGEEMVESAQNYIMGQLPDNLETGSQLADTFAQIEFYGLDTSYIDGYGEAIAAVTTESVAAVIDDVYPKEGNLVFVLLGDAEQIRESIQKYGPVTEFPIAEPSFAVPESAAEADSADD